MSQQSVRADRVFKTAWFSKAAKKAFILDDELCVAIQQVMLGQADDLGGGVFKKRLNKNMYRSIILARSGKFWVYEHLFAKKDTANIPPDKLMDLRKLVKSYEVLTKQQIDELVDNKFWMEICHGNQA
jgi:hypothetical protein